VPGLWNKAPLAPKIAAVAAGSFRRKDPPAICGTGYVVECLTRLRLRPTSYTWSGETIRLRSREQAGCDRIAPIGIAKAISWSPEGPPNDRSRP
jgi:hypothetical protein